MLVNKLSRSKLDIKFLELNLLILLANKNESWTVYSFSVKGFKIGTRNLAKSYVGVSMTDRIGRKDGQLFSTIMDFSLSVENAWFWSCSSNFQMFTFSKTIFYVQGFNNLPKSSFFIKNKI